MRGKYPHLRIGRAFTCLVLLDQCCTLVLQPGLDLLARSQRKLQPHGSGTAALLGIAPDHVFGGERTDGQRLELRCAGAVLRIERRQLQLLAQHQRIGKFDRVKGGLHFRPISQRLAVLPNQPLLTMSGQQMKCLLGAQPADGRPVQGFAPSLADFGA